MVESAAALFPPRKSSMASASFRCSLPSATIHAAWTFMSASAFQNVLYQRMAACGASPGCGCDASTTGRAVITSGFGLMHAVVATSSAMHVIRIGGVCFRYWALCSAMVGYGRSTDPICIQRRTAPLETRSYILDPGDIPFVSVLYLQGEALHGC